MVLSLSLLSYESSVPMKESPDRKKILCLGNISKDFTISNMRKTGLKEVVKVFTVDDNAVDTNNILNIHRYLMNKTC